jgi:hypothetical protein
MTKRKYTKVTEDVWTEIISLWESGGVTLFELSERFGPTPRALQARFRRSGVVKGSRATAMAALVRERIQEEDLDDQDRLVIRSRDIRERAYRNALVVEDLVMSQLTLAERDPGQIFRVNSSLKALSLAAASLERLHDLKQRALGLDKEAALPEELPVLAFVDLTSDDIAQIRAQQGDYEGVEDDFQVDSVDADESEIVEIDA